MSAVVLVSPEELTALVRKAVAEEVTKLPQGGTRDVLNLKQAAEFLDRSTRTVTELVATKGLPAHYISDREPRFIRSELVAWLANLQSKPTEKSET